MSAPPSSASFAPNSQKIPILELVPFCGCVCCVTSLYTEFPDCIGCAGKRICLCCYSDFMACKLPLEHEEVWCNWDAGRTYCAPVETCCMNRGQFFCCDVRCALPLTDDIPVVITCCFFTFYFKDTCGPFECFRTVKELAEDALALNGPPVVRAPLPPQHNQPQSHQAYPQHTQPHQNQPPPQQYVQQQPVASPLAPPVANP